MSIDRDPAFLVDIANSCRLMLNFIAGRNRNDLDTDLQFQSAVLHQLMVLGEAARRLSDDFRASHPETDWRGFIGLRNVLIHQYDVVNLDQVWNIVVQEVPDLLKHIDAVLPDEAN